MPRNYEYKEVAVQELLLDEENPRFASSILVKESTNKITQEMIIEHLLRYSDVIKLAQRINEVGELHGSEIITCTKKGDKFVVLEGNRRTCACKLLLDRKLIPEQYRSNFPFITEHAKANIEKVTLRYVTLRRTKGEIRQNYYFFAILNEEVSDDLVSNEGELKWFSLNKLDELEMPYTARYVMDHYCLVGQYSDKIYTGVANENEVIFLELPEF